MLGILKSEHSGQIIDVYFTNLSHVITQFVNYNTMPFVKAYWAENYFRSGSVLHDFL
jgi:hypothetical protein